MRVKDIMTPKVELVSPDVTIQEAAKIMRDENIGSLPVGENDRLIGMVTDRDITCRAVAEGSDPAKTKIRDIVSKKITYCFDDQDVADAARLMEGKHIRRLAVLNREKRMVGFLSVDDITRCSHDLAGEVLEAVSQRPCH
jgi:CBS domain-containing protein